MTLLHPAHSRRSTIGLLPDCFSKRTHSASWSLSSQNQLPPPPPPNLGFWKNPWVTPLLILCQLTHPLSPLLIFPIMPRSVSSPCANSSPSPVFIPFRCLQAIIMYPLSQAAHIKFFSSFLINQSLNPSKPFNRTSCSSLNSVQFPQVSDDAVTKSWMRGSSCWLSELPGCQGAPCMRAHQRPHLGGWTPCLASSQHPFYSHIIMNWLQLSIGLQRAHKHFGVKQNLKGEKKPRSKFYSPVRFSLVIPTHVLRIEIMPLRSRGI